MYTSSSVWFNFSKISAHFHSLHPCTEIWHVIQRPQTDIARLYNISGIETYTRVRDRQSHIIYESMSFPVSQIIACRSIYCSHRGTYRGCGRALIYQLCLIIALSNIRMSLCIMYESDTLTIFCSDHFYFAHI